MSSSRIIIALTVFATFVFNASSEVSVMVFSKDEALHEKNISKPRIFIKNTGTEPIRNFYYLYFFTVENGKTPVIEDYYTPNESVSLEYLGYNRYAVRYDYHGVTLYPGQVLPDPNGNVIGIHYPNWEPFCKEDDKSFNFSSELVPNREIAVFSEDGYRIDKRTSHHRRGKRINRHENSINIDIDVYQ